MVGMTTGGSNSHSPLPNSQLAQVVERTGVFGKLSDAVRSLKSVPPHYVQRDLAALNHGTDGNDNQTLEYGPVPLLSRSPFLAPSSQATNHVWWY